MMGAGISVRKGRSGVRIFNTQIRGLGGISIRVPHGDLAIVAKLDNDNGSSLTFSAVFTRKRQHCVRAFSTCTHGFLNGLRHPSISGVANLDPMVSVRRGAAGGGPHSAINAAARVCSFLHLLCTHTKRTCSCLSNRGVIHCARRRVVSLVVESCRKHHVCLLTPIIHGHGKRCGRLFRDVHHGNCLCIYISKRVQRITRNVGISHCGGRDVRVIMSGLHIRRDSSGHLHSDVTATVRRNSKRVVILSTSAKAIQRCDGHLVYPRAKLTCHSPTPRGFSFGSPRKTYPHYGKLNCIDLVSVSGIVPSHDLSICSNTVLPLKGCGGDVVF